LKVNGMRIGEFAKRAGLSASKIRFYEGRGLLPDAARSANGYRDYGATDLRVIGFIDRARALGFSLSDVARFMKRPVEERRAKHGLVEALEAKLAEIDDHLAEVRSRRQHVVALLTEMRIGHHGDGPSKRQT
jgi:MerR family transcriptional regulator, copper efflux regulator